MKTKEWIAKLQKLDQEKELYFHVGGDEDWGYYIPNPRIQAQNLCKSKYEKQWLIYDEMIAEEEAKPLGLCNTVDI
mgnify:CR=1 FL=1